MNCNRYANLVEATNDLPKRGFTESFKFEDGKMICVKSKTNYTPNEMKIKESHRFEGYSNPADNSVIFAVECNDGKKGMVISSYGPGASLALDEFMKSVEIVPNQEKVDFSERTHAPRKPH